MVVEELHGPMTEGDSPHWRPLLRVLDETLVDSFMWMFAVWTTARKPLHAYKHCDTRRYLHLDRQGQAYTYCNPDRYRPVPLDAALADVFCGWRELGASPRELRLARAAVLGAICRRNGSAEPRASGK